MRSAITLQQTQSAYFDNTGTGMDCFREAQYLIFNHHLHHEGAFKASTSVTKNKYFKREDYYQLISPVFQEVRTAFFTLAETVSGQNLGDTDLKRVEACMRQAGLGEKIDELPEEILTKLNKKVHKNGTELSGGEAQKLMLARALYKEGCTFACTGRTHSGAGSHCRKPDLYRI